MTPGLIIAGFHRSGTSLAAQILHGAGLSLGERLGAPDRFNPRGHFEDTEVVALHDRILERHGSSWQFHDEVVLAPDAGDRDAMAMLRARRAERDRPWGFKDPRASLFLVEWCAADPRDGVLILYRHWSACLRSLQARAANQLCVQRPEGGGEPLALFRDPELPLKMWLAYNRRLLAFASAEPERCLVVPHTALLEGYPLLERLRTRFDLSLREATDAVADARLVHHGPADRTPGWLTRERVAALDTCWRELNAHADAPSAAACPGQGPREQAAFLLERVDARLASQGAVRALPPESNLDAQAADADACRGEAERLLQAGMLRAALGWAERASRRQETAALASLSSRIRLGLGDFDEARRAARRAIELEPDQPAPYLQLANAEAASGDLDAALRHLDEALDRSPEGDVPLRVRRGWLRRFRGDLDLAIEDFESVRTRHPRHAGALHGLVDVRRERGEYERALDLAERLEALHPELVPPQKTHATLLMEMGRTQDGLRKWRRAEQRSFDPQQLRNRLELEYLPAMNSETARANFLAAILGCLDELTPPAD